MSKERFSIPVIHKELRFQIVDFRLNFFLFLNSALRISNSRRRSKLRTVKSFRKALLVFILCHIGFPSTLISLSDPASEWHLLYLKIRDGLMVKEDAQSRLRELEILLKKIYPKDREKGKEHRLCFPLKGYSPNSIGGRRGSGYKTEGYDFFDGNQHKGHPGHDLFIRDKNQDGLDDDTGKPVEVLSASSGIVVSVNLDWKPSSPIRGGNYIWIYDPVKDRYYYYAHLNEVFVKVGQRVFKGERLGTVGRTGLSAYRSKSPTHLHFTVHHSLGGCPTPINPYHELIQAIQK